MIAPGSTVDVDRLLKSSSFAFGIPEWAFLYSEPKYALACKLSFRVLARNLGLGGAGRYATRYFATLSMTG